jgi:hypothetical protein
VAVHSRYTSGLIFSNVVQDGCVYLVAEGSFRLEVEFPAGNAGKAGIAGAATQGSGILAPSTTRKVVVPMVGVFELLGKNCDKSLP